MKKIKIYQDLNTTFSELRYTENIKNCEKSHIHNTLTITAIENGIQEIFLNNTITTGKIAVINPYEPHFGKNITPLTSGGYVFYIDLLFCEKLQTELFKNFNGFIPVSPNIINNKELYNNFILLCKLLLSDSPNIEKESEIINFISIIFLQYCNVEVKNYEFLENDYLKKILDYLDYNYLNEITLKDISNFINLSPFYLLKIFKNKYGIPPHSYILNKKVHKAKELLLTGCPISTAAVESGFYDQSHLNREFKKIFSITPKEYQNNLLKK